MRFLLEFKTYHEYASDMYFEPLHVPSLDAAAPMIRGIIQQTFVALRMREWMAPCLKLLLNRNGFDKLVADETANIFGKDPNQETYDKAFHYVLETSEWPMNVVFENDNVLRYMIGNINLSSPMLNDVLEVNRVPICIEFLQ
jgi:hypothetical protein